MRKVLKLIGDIIIFLLLILLVLNLVVIIKSKLKPNSVPGLFGYKPLVVLSGSMKSQIDVGDLVIVKEDDAKNIKVNDIIAFKTKKTVVAHRVRKVYKTNKGICFETKGDSNNVADDKLACDKALVGKYIFKISKLGNFILFIQKPLGFALLLISILFIGTVMYIIENNRLNKELLKEKEEELRRAKNANKK